MFTDSKCSLAAKNLCIKPMVTCVESLMYFFWSAWLQSINQLINQSVNQPINQSVNQPINIKFTPIFPKRCIRFFPFLNNILYVLNPLPTILRVASHSKTTTNNNTDTFMVQMSEVHQLGIYFNFRQMFWFVQYCIQVFMRLQWLLDLFQN